MPLRPDPREVALVFAEPRAAASRSPADLPAQPIFDNFGRVAANVCGHATGVQRVDVPGVASFAFTIGEARVRVTAEPGIARERVAAAYGDVLPFILQRHGYESLHGSAVVAEGAAWALGGRSHAGKSTLAFALSRRGWPRLGDDALVLDLASAPCAAWPLPFRAGLRPDAAAHFGQPDAGADEPAISGSVPLGGIFLLQPEEPEATPRLERIAPAEAFPLVLALAVVSPWDDRERTRATVENYLKLVAAVPVERLIFPRSFDHLDEVIRLVRARVAVQARLS